MTPCLPRMVDGLTLGTRRVAGVFVHRHADLIRRRCHPVACDVKTRADLYDLDAVAATFRATPRRSRRVA